MISCHDPNNFKNPDDYVPERWLIDDTKSSSRSSECGANIVVPFGVGKRQCPGKRFVEMELMIIVAKVRSICAFCAQTLHIPFKSNHRIHFILSPILVGPFI